MRIGLIQRFPIHSEVFGPLMHLCKILGHTITLYHEPDVLSMVPLFKKWLNMEVVESRSANRIHVDAPFLDKIVLITSDEWKPSHSMGFPDAFADKLIKVHHDSLFYRTGEICFMLTPFAGVDRWIFPLYPLHVESPQTVDVDGIAIIGSINNSYNKTRDMGDICKYLETGNILHVFARGPEHAPVQFSNLRGRWGLTSNKMIEELAAIKYVWFPINKESLYANRIFTGGLSLAVNMRKIMIMPRFYAEAYGLTSCAVTYDQSILEVDFAAIPQNLIKASMDLWITEREKQNIKVFQSLLCC